MEGRNNDRKTIKTEIVLKTFQRSSWKLHIGECDPKYSV